MTSGVRRGSESITYNVEQQQQQQQEEEEEKASASSTSAAAPGASRWRCTRGCGHTYGAAAAMVAATAVGAAEAACAC